MRSNRARSPIVRWLRVWRAMPLVGLLSACAAVGPNYSVPRQAAVNAPYAQGAIPGGDGSGVMPQAAVPDRWWHLYDDPVLDDLVVRALRSNADLRVAAANLARSRASVSEAEAQGGFSGNFMGGVKRAQESGEAYLLPDRVPVTNEGDFGISVSYEFDVFGTLKRGVEAARADDDAVAAAGDVARITVAADVVRAYVQACSAGEALRIAQHSIDLQQQSLLLTRRLRDAGRGNQSEVTRSETQQHTLDAEVPAYQARQRSAFYMLAMLLAEAPDQLPEAVKSCAVTPRVNTPVPVGDAAALLKRRPDVRQAERRLAASTARIGVAIGALYPNIVFGASAGVTGAAGDLGSPATQRWGVGPALSWTLPANGARARIVEARAGSAVTLAQFDSVVLKALRETETNLAVYSGNLDRLELLNRADQSAADSARQTRQLYTAGRLSFLADLDAQRTLASSDAQVASARAQTAMSQIDLFLSLGGGWQRADDAKIPQKP